MHGRPFSLALTLWLRFAPTLRASSLIDSSDSPKSKVGHIPCTGGHFGVPLQTNRRFSMWVKVFLFHINIGSFHGPPCSYGCFELPTRCLTSLEGLRFFLARPSCLQGTILVWYFLLFSYLGLLQAPLRCIRCAYERRVLVEHPPPRVFRPFVRSPIAQERQPKCPTMK